jgi:hypothetical protein
VTGPDPQPYIPRPYVPPPSRPAPEPIPKKPWMVRRPGETKEHFEHRVAHSCYRCGLYLVPMAVLNAHEDACKGPVDDAGDDAARWRS